MGSGASKDSSNGASGSAASSPPNSSALKIESTLLKKEISRQESSRTQTKAAQERVKKARDMVGNNDRESDEFHNACMVVFQNADINGDGMLDRSEFWNVLHSKSLNLNLSNEEKAEFLRMAGVDQDGRISYKDFVPIVKRLLQRVYQKKSVDWNDWCWVRVLKGWWRAGEKEKDWCIYDLAGASALF